MIYGAVRAVAVDSHEFNGRRRRVQEMRKNRLRSVVNDRVNLKIINTTTTYDDATVALGVCNDVDVGATWVCIVCCVFYYHPYFRYAGKVNAARSSRVAHSHVNHRLSHPIRTNTKDNCEVSLNDEKTHQYQ